MLGILGQIGAGVLVSNIVEWGAHKLVLHDLGKRKDWLGRTWGYHWVHHRHARVHDMHDADYEQPWYSEARIKEIVGIGVLAVGPCLLISHLPVFTATTIAYAGVYLYAHRRAHLDPEFCDKYLSHHKSHHMGNQNTNFGILSPMADILFGTYKRHSEDDYVVRKAPNLRVVS